MKIEGEQSDSAALERYTTTLGDDDWLEKNFTISKKVGAGSFGRVYKVYARDDASRTPYACKIMPVMHDDDHLQLELNILRVIGGRHSVIGAVCIYRSSVEYFAVMPYIHHTPFKNIVDTLTGDAVYDYIKQLMSALSHLHMHNIAHLDVKPTNFLYDSHRKRYALIDFGLCKAFESGNAYHDDSRMSALNESAAKEASASRPAHRKLFDASETDNEKDENNEENEGPSQAKRPKVKSPTHKASVNTQLKSRHLAAVAFRQQKCACAESGDRVCKICERRPLLNLSSAGTAGYRAPETLLNVGSPTAAVDVWAAGIILMQLLCGRTPLMRDKRAMPALSHIAILCGMRRVIDFAHRHQLNFNMRPTPPEYGINLWQLAIAARGQTAKGISKQKSSAQHPSCEKCSPFVRLYLEGDASGPACLCADGSEPDPDDFKAAEVPTDDRLSMLNNEQRAALRYVLLRSLCVDPRDRCTAADAAMHLSAFDNSGQ